MFPDGLTTAEVAAVMAPHLQPPGPRRGRGRADRARSRPAPPSGRAFGNDALWVPGGSECARWPGWVAERTRLGSAGFRRDRRLAAASLAPAVSGRPPRTSMDNDFMNYVESDLDPRACSSSLALAAGVPRAAPAPRFRLRFA